MAQFHWHHDAWSQGVQPGFENEVGATSNSEYEYQYLQRAVAPTGLQEGAGHRPGRALSGVPVRADSADLDETMMVRTHRVQGFV